MTPIEKDFDVQVQEGGVRVIFKSIESEYFFRSVVDPEDIAQIRAGLKRSPCPTCCDR